jgi:hypothetical protein
MESRPPERRAASDLQSSGQKLAVSPCVIIPNTVQFPSRQLSARPLAVAKGAPDLHERHEVGRPSDFVVSRAALRGEGQGTNRNQLGASGWHGVAHHPVSDGPCRCGDPKWTTFDLQQLHNHSVGNLASYRLDTHHCPADDDHGSDPHDNGNPSSDHPADEHRANGHDESEHDHHSARRQPAGHSPPDDDNHPVVVPQ